MTDWHDVTAEFSDLNAWDRVFRAPDGSNVKVKVVSIPTDRAEHINLCMTASLCDAAGKALPHPETDGHFIGSPHMVSIQADGGDADIEAHVEAGRLHVAQRLAKAADNRSRVRAIPGVLIPTRPDTHRKGAIQ